MTKNARRRGSQYCLPARVNWTDSVETYYVSTAPAGPVAPNGSYVPVDSPEEREEANKGASEHRDVSSFEAR